MENWEFYVQMLGRLAVGAFAAYVIYYFIWRKPADFTIQLRRGQFNCRGRVPLVHQGAIARFLLDELALKDSVKIQGAWNHKRLRLWFSGRIGEGEKQRIRNFLLGRL
jgi:hypothetical protein